MSAINGVVVGLVTNVNDPKKQGRIRVHFPWLEGGHETDWVRIATMMAGDDRGSFFMPEVDDEVLVAFEHGDARFPYVIGFLWNGRDRPPAQQARDRVLKSKNGHTIKLLDATPAAGSLGALVIEDAHGNVIELANARITIRSVAAIEILAPSVSINGRPVAPVPNPI